MNIVQQYYWVPNRHVAIVLKGGVKISPPKKMKPAGVWISPFKDGWETSDVDRAVKNCTPLKAYISSQTKICHIESLKDVKSICERYNIPKIVGIDESIDRVGNTELFADSHRVFFEKIIFEGYDGIHITRKAALDLDDNDILIGWDIDSTVIFYPKNLSFELMTKKEIRQLGWDKYDWIITKESYSLHDDKLESKGSGGVMGFLKRNAGFENKNDGLASEQTRKMREDLDSKSHLLDQDTYNNLLQLLSEISALPHETKDQLKRKKQLLDKFRKDFGSYFK